MTRFVSILLAVLLATACAADTPRDGDLVFQTSRSGQSLAVQRATHSPWSHMGVIVMRDGKPFVFEANATVRYTPLEAWAAHGDGGRYAVRRLKQPLTAVQAASLRAAAGRYTGRPYDRFFEWSDDRIYCSELAWKLYHDALGIEIGARQRLREFDLSDPVVRAQMRERYAGHVPLDEPVISPGAMYDSRLLKTIVFR
jgi:hypothetical protein